MRRTLLLTLLLALPACIGSDCSGHGRHPSTGGTSSFATTANNNPSGEGSLDVADDGTVAPVPEPSAALVFSVGLLVAGAAARRRNR